MSGPVAAAMEVVETAFGQDGAAVCAGLVRELRGDKVTAERAARGLKKVSERDRAALYGLRRELLRAALAAEDIRVQWNLTIVIGRLPLKGRDKALAVELMFERLGGGSLNRTFALQALVDLAEDDPGLLARVRPMVLEACESMTPAVRARAKRLWKTIR
jgi:hypothetical protein